MAYWFEDVFSQRIENTTRMVCVYVLYDLILPNMQQDIKLRYANEEYFDSRLAVVSKACESAGNKSREFLNMAMEEAVIQEYIKRNPITATMPYPRSEVMDENAQIQVLLEKSKDTPIRMQVLLNVLMGFRRSEINGVKYSDVNYINHTLKVERQVYEKNRNRKKRGFQDLGYICCSTLGRARSKGFHCRYYKQLLAENGLLYTVRFC